MSRLVYRKGVDLLAAAIPLICKRCPAVDFVIGGDGPKRRLLEEVVAAHGLAGRVKLLGDVAHGDVRGVLRRGHIFLSASLTESFGIAVLEAACCGMLVVATAVGGVPEVLPPSIMRLAPPAPGPLADAVVAAAADAAGVQARGDARAAGHAWAQHAAVRDMYSWADVAERVERVYMRAATSQGGLYDRLRRYSATGRCSGVIFATVAAANALLMALLELLAPASSIDIVPD
jgi:phosphatidylinositol glycan class A protein